MKRSFLHLLLMSLVFHCCSLFVNSCAQIGAPVGGPKDTAAPILIKASPDNYQTNFNANKISLTFDEFIELKDLQNNFFVSPMQKNNPTVSSNLRTITIKLKDSLLTNTTYSIDLGNSIKDINEGNVFKNFSYIFSTGNFIDSLEINGKVVMAESGKPDSTLKVLLYRNGVDSSVSTRKPDYITFLQGDGNFSFKNLPAGNFLIFVLKDGDGNKYYNLKSEIFAFNDREINTTDKNDSLLLFAYAEKKTPIFTSAFDKKNADKKLRYTTNLMNSKQDLLSPLELAFTSPLKIINLDSVFIADTNFLPVQVISTDIDTSRKKISILKKWKEDEKFFLIFSIGAFEDSSGRKLTKADTISFKTKSISEYGSLKLVFNNLDISRHPLLEFIEANNIKWKFPLTSNEWLNKMLAPGEYEVRILYYENNNGEWDPGNYSRKLQPERAITLPQKISVKANWENERDVQL